MPTAPMTMMPVYNSQPLNLATGTGGTPAERAAAMYGIAGFNPSVDAALAARAGTPGASVISPNPTYQDIMARLDRPYAGGDTFQKGINATTPTAPGILDPGYQKTLDQIRSNAEFYGKRAGSNAQALAVRRGGAGSSVEQFGVQTALDNVNRTAADQEAQIYLENVKRQQAQQDATANAYFGRAQQEGGYGQATGIAGAQLTSDEVASNRNALFQQQQLELQRILGQQGIDLGYANVGASRDIAKQQGQYDLYGSLAQSVLPGLLFGGGGAGGGGAGGGGFLSGLFGGGGAAGGYGAPLAGGAIGPTGPAAGPVGGFMNSPMALAGVAGLGVMGYQSLSDKGKAMIAPLVNPISTFKTVSKAVSKVFRF